MADPSSGQLAAIVPLFSPIVSLVAMCVSGFFAWTTISIGRKDRESKNHLEQAILALTRAYEALTSCGPVLAPVAPDRLNWLTAARHIEAYKLLKKSVTEPSHRVICEDTEEYWRHRFYVALNMYKILHSAYYEADPSTQKSDLAIPSLIIVYGFASWPDGKSDSITQADLAGIIRQHDIRKGNIGLSTYIQKSPKWQKLFDALGDRRKDVKAVSN